VTRLSSADRLLLAVAGGDRLLLLAESRTYVLAGAAFPHRAPVAVRTVESLVGAALLRPEPRPPYPGSFDGILRTYTLTTQGIERVAQLRRQIGQEHP